jgi:hypothetical protein
VKYVLIPLKKYLLGFGRMYIKFKTPAVTLLLGK